MRGDDVTAVVLAAGLASRYGAAKLLVPLDARPMLQHVLDALSTAGIEQVVVVVGSQAEPILASVDLGAARIVHNPSPESGLSSSLRLGLAAVASDASLIVLGDQPTLRVDVIDSLLAADPSGAAPAVMPEYAEGGGANPVLLRRTAFPLADRLRGDTGLGRLLVDLPGAVRVPVAGSIQDVDTPADLVDLIENRWASQVRANREQVDRLREVPDGPDFYGPVSSLFRADPLRTDDPVLDGLLEETRPGETWLDVGAGAGRFALPIARHVRQVIAVDPSERMLGALMELAEEHAITNVRPILERWPMAEPPSADGVLIAHVGYDIEAIGPFVDALEAAAHRRCLAVLMERQPASTVDPFWPLVHGEARVALPALPAFLELLAARGARCDVTYFPRPAARYGTFDEILAFARRQTWVAEGGAKDQRLIEAVRARATQSAEGWTLPTPEMRIGIVAWDPVVRPSDELGAVGVTAEAAG